jgi:hypothetical protein
VAGGLIKEEEDILLNRGKAQAVVRSWGEIQSRILPISCLKQVEKIYT